MSTIIFPTGVPAATPATGDSFMFADASDSNKLKDATLADLPVSTATTTALNAKQDTLVSGTNIRTINGTSLLGSGNIAIAGAGTVTDVSSANADIAVATGTTTPVLTLNSGTGANQIVKLDGTAKLPAVDGSQLTNLPGGSPDWGDIGGTLSNQTDLQTALDGKVDENVAITGATKTKITYDAKGLVTSGADATTADIADSSNKRYVTDAQLTVIGNTSGINTGDQTSVTGNAGTVTIVDAGGDTTTFPLLGTAATGDLSPATDAGLTYNATTNALTTTTFVGALTGNADTATTATAANGLNSATTTVSVSAATAPSSGQVLTATSSTAATWQAPAAAGEQLEQIADYSGTAFIGVLGTFIFNAAKTLDEVSITADSIPVGSNLIVELRNNSYTGTNVLSSTLQIATSDSLTNGKKTVSVTSFSDASMADGDYIVAYLTSVGSTTASLNPIVTVRFH